MRKLVLLALIALAALAYQATFDTGPAVSSQALQGAAVADRDPELRAGRQAKGSGKVIRILPDDNDGSRHQRFILELPSGRTLLIAHNIDLAPRIPGLREGDTVSFYGEFEPNERGGVIHWTHHDPRGRHVGGWLEYRGRRYE